MSVALADELPDKSLGSALMLAFGLRRTCVRCTCEQIGRPHIVNAARRSTHQAMERYCTESCTFESLHASSCHNAHVIAAQAGKGGSGRSQQSKHGGDG